jgi:alpha-beta hydrolase superfamily lysophospholipase
LKPVRQLVFNLTIQSVGRLLLLRDLAFGWARVNWRIDPGAAGVSRHAIGSGKNVLDAVLVRPTKAPARAGLLICHGIGETVQRWQKVQQLLAAHGVASLVFDYSGYGRSTGFFGAPESEQDAIAAFRFFEEQADGLPISLLGFSLGSGIATAILPRVPARSLVLGAAFTSLRDAARSTGVPGFLNFCVPPIWRAEDVLRSCTVPALIVHGERDRLFPVTMAAELGACCGSHAKVIIVPRLAHNEPFGKPTLGYWGLIIDHLLGEESAEGS